MYLNFENKNLLMNLIEDKSISPPERLNIVIVGGKGQLMNELMFIAMNRRIPGEFMPAIMEKQSAGIVINGKEVAVSMQSISGRTSKDDIEDRINMYVNADIVLFGFSIDDRQSLAEIWDVWVPEVRQYTHSDVKWVLVGIGKQFRARRVESDSEILKETDLVLKEEAEYVLENMEGLLYIEVSTLDPYGLCDSIEEVVKRSLGVLLRKNDPSESFFAFLQRLGKKYPFIRHVLYSRMKGEQKGHSKPISCIAAFENIIFTGSADCTVRAWHASSGILLRVFRQSNPVLALCCQKEYLVVVDRFSITLWSVYKSKALFSKFVNPNFRPGVTFPIESQNAIGKHQRIEVTFFYYEGTDHFVHKFQFTDDCSGFSIKSSTMPLERCPAEFKKISPKTVESMDGVTHVKAYYLDGSTLDRPMLVFASYINGDIVCYDGDGRALQYFMGDSKKLRWTEMNDPFMNRKCSKLTKEQREELSFRPNKSGWFEKQIYRSFPVLDLEFIDAQNFSIFAADKDATRDRGLSRARYDEGTSMDQLEQSKKSSQVKRFLCLIRLTTNAISFFSITSGICVKLIQYKDKGLPTRLSAMTVTTGKDSVEIFVSTTNKVGEQLIIHYSEPFQDIRQGDKAMKSDTKIEIGGCVFHSRFEETRSPTQIRENYAKPIEYRPPFYLDNFDVSFLPKHRLDENEEAVLLGSSCDGQCWVSFLGDEEHKGVDHQKNNFVFRQYEEFQGIGHQLVHKSDFITTSTVLDHRQSGPPELGSFDLLSRKEKIRGRSILWWESVTEWFMFFKDHCEMLSLSFQSEFYWPSNGAGTVFVAMAFDPTGFFTGTAFLTVSLLSLIFMLFALLGYFVLGNPKMANRIPTLVAIWSIYLPTISALGLFTISNIAISILDCNRTDGKLEHNLLKGVSGFEICFEGGHFVIFILMSFSFVLFFVMSIRIRSLNGISGISRDHWMSLNWRYDENDTFYGIFWLRNPSVAYEVSYTSTRISLVVVALLLQSYPEVQVYIYMIASIALIALTLFILHPYARKEANSLNLSFFILILYTNIFTFLIFKASSTSQRITLSDTFSYGIPLLLIATYSVSLMFNNMLSDLLLSRKFPCEISNDLGRIQKANRQSRKYGFLKQKFECHVIEGEPHDGHDEIDLPLEYRTRDRKELKIKKLTRNPIRKASVGSVTALLQDITRKMSQATVWSTSEASTEQRKASKSITEDIELGRIDGTSNRRPSRGLQLQSMNSPEMRQKELSEQGTRKFGLLSFIRSPKPESSRHNEEHGVDLDDDVTQAVEIEAAPVPHGANRLKDLAAKFGG